MFYQCDFNVTRIKLDPIKVHRSFTKEKPFLNFCNNYNFDLQLLHEFLMLCCYNVSCSTGQIRTALCTLMLFITSRWHFALVCRTPTSPFASRQQRALVSADLTITHRSRLSRAPPSAVKWRLSREPRRPVRPADVN